MGKQQNPRKVVKAADLTDEQLEAIRNAEPSERSKMLDRLLDD